MINIFLTLFLSLTVHAEQQTLSSSVSLEKCLKNARRPQLREQREAQRMSCVQSFRSRINFDQCLTLARGMEYSFNVDKMSMSCLTNEALSINASNCRKTLKQMIYAESKEDLTWMCLREVKNLTQKQCLSLAKSFTFAFQKERASSFCKSEI